MMFIEFKLVSGGAMFISPGSVYRVTAEPAVGATRIDAGADSPVVAFPLKDVVDLLRKAGVTLVELVRAEGSLVYLNVKQISLVRDTQGGDPADTKAVVMVSGKRQALEQTPKAARDAIVAAAEAAAPAPVAAPAV